MKPKKLLLKSFLSLSSHHFIGITAEILMQLNYFKEVIKVLYLIIAIDLRVFDTVLINFFTTYIHK